PHLHSFPTRRSSDLAWSTLARPRSTRTWSVTATALWPNLLPDLLPDRSKRTRTRAHRSAPRSREGATQTHQPTPTGTDRQAPRAAHNPKVAGSNPTPATDQERGGQAVVPPRSGHGSKPGTQTIW